MCGILGFVGNLDSTISKSLFTDTLQVLKHRGPDDQGIQEIDYRGKCGFLGQTRLSIIDLSHKGHQPFESKDGRYILVFNGEIYNYLELREQLFSIGYSFESDSDTEVLLTAWIEWGEGCLDKLIGMFSFVVFDKFKGTLHCARDPFGIKPLFFSASQGSFLFASEMRGITKLAGQSLELDQNSALQFLAKGHYDRSVSTFAAGISHLKPGHLLFLNLNESSIDVEIKRWWKPKNLNLNRLSFHQAADQLRELFLSSVELHMRSDVRIAAALSGGLDSSAILCALRKLQPEAEIHSFSYISDDKNTSEEIWVDKVNDSLFAKAHKIHITRDEMLSDLDDLISTQGEPFGSTSIYAQYKVFQSAQENGVKVVLDGQGADEIFAGYHGYQNSRIDTLFSHGQYTTLMRFLYQWGTFPGRPKNQTYQYALSKLLPQNLKTFLSSFRSNLIYPEWLNDEIEFDEKSDFDIAEISRAFDTSVPRQLLSDLTSTSLPALLRHADRNSMRWSIESRVPFLTSEIVNFALSLPENYLISNSGETKSILRAALRGIVPEEVLFRKDKVGFQTPEISLLRDSKFLDAIKDFQFSPTGLLDKESTLRFATDFVEGRNSDARGFWRIYNFIRWIQLTGVKH